MKRVFKDLPIDEITLRRFEKPSSDDLKTLVRTFAISVGLLQPGDSRDVVSTLLLMFVEAGKKKEFIAVENLIEKLKDEDGGTPNNIRRQLRRLKDLNIIERTSYGYRMKEFLPLLTIFKEFIMKFNIEPSVNRLEEYAKKIDEL